MNIYLLIITSYIVLYTLFFIYLTKNDEVSSINLKHLIRLIFTSLILFTMGFCIVIATLYVFIWFYHPILFLWIICFGSLIYRLCKIVE